MKSLHCKSKVLVLNGEGIAAGSPRVLVPIAFGTERSPMIGSRRLAPYVSFVPIAGKLFVMEKGVDTGAS